MIRKTVNFGEEEKNNNPKGKRRRTSRKGMANVVQKLYETCKEVFADGGAGFVPPPEDIERLQLVLDSMNPEDVSLAPSMPYFKETDNEESPPVTYVHIYECDKFSIGIFCLPPSGVIPLHNHPGMTVFSKLLFGSMHIKSYDWVPHIPQNIVTSLTYSERGGSRLAKVHSDSDFTVPCKASILYPAAGGNMHCFEALTPCAILDVLGPPYSEAEGRHCAYFSDHPCARFSELLPEEDKEEYAWIEEIEKPEHFVVVGAMYEGPTIVEN